MPPRTLTTLLLALLLVAAVAVPAVIVAVYVGGQLDLEQRVERLETDVSLLRE